MKFNTKVSLFLFAMFLNYTANAGSGDEMDINADQNQIQPKADSNNNAISGKRKKFKTNKKLVRAQNKATKRTKDAFYDESNASVKTNNCDIYYDQPESELPESELYAQDPEEMDYLCDLLANINVGASCEERKFKTGNH
ncbi:MAG: hypothetical protein Q8S31_08670 [Alphaproteobacteria bacterium]|nr:hypothetical protein [Alphaproteobacteria bacterium]